jgi:hypothetical protein
MLMGFSWGTAGLATDGRKRLKRLAERGRLETPEMAGNRALPGFGRDGTTPLEEWSTRHAL